MYFNRKNAEQKNWRMIKKGKHFLFGCSLVFAVGAALVAPSVKADAVDAKPEASSTTEGIKPVAAEENATYAAPAVEVAPSTPVAPATVVAEEKAVVVENTTAKTANKEALTQLVEEVKVLDKAGKTEDSLARLNTALDQAQKVLDNAEASQEQVDAALASLKDAVAQLAAKEEKAATVATEEKTEVKEAEAAVAETEVARPRGKRAANRSIDGSLGTGEFTGEGVKQFESVRYSVDGDKTTWTIEVVPEKASNTFAGLAVTSDDTISSIRMIGKSGKFGNNLKDQYLDLPKRPDNMPFANYKVHMSEFRTIGGGIPDNIVYEVVTNGKNHNLFGRFATALVESSLKNNGLNGKSVIGARTSDFPTVGVSLKSKLPAETPKPQPQPETPKPVTPTTQAPEITSNLSGKASTPADVTVKAPAGSTVKLYNKDGVVIGEAVANDQGVATVHPTNSLPEGEITATSTPAGGSESAKSAPITVTKSPITESGLNRNGDAYTQLLLSKTHITVYPGDNVDIDVIGAASSYIKRFYPVNPNSVYGLFPDGIYFQTTGSQQHRQLNNKYHGTVHEKQPAGDFVTTFVLESKNGKVVSTPLKITVLESAKKYEPVAGAKVEVADVNNVSEAEKTKIIAAAKAANTSLPSSATYSVDEKGNLVITYADKSTDKISAAYLVTPAADTEAPAKPVVNTDLTGKAGTKTPVEVTAEKGSTVALYDKDGNKIGEATAGENGKATITPSVNIPAGAVTAKATDAAGNTSVASDPATATPAADTEAPAKPVVNTDLTGKAGTKTPVEVTAEKGSTVALYDKDNNKIGEATAGENGKATITPTVDIPAGAVTAKATDVAGNTSVASDPATATPPADTEAPAKPVVNTDLTGKAGTKTPVEVTAEKGSTVALYDKDNNKIGEATAGENGKATITPTVDIPAGAVTAKATDAAGNTSVASDPATATAPATVVAPTVEIPYSNKDKEVYVYAGEENSFDIKFKDDSGKIVSATVKQGGNREFGSVAGEADTINTQYGFKANVISTETPATATAPAVITYRGTPAATDGLKPEVLEAATKGENPKGMVLGWRYATATDADGAFIENKAVGSSTATDPGAFRVVLKAQSQKYDIATPTEKVTVADPANVTEAELGKIKEKLQLEYSKTNDDANLADKKGKAVADKDGKIQSVAKDADGNLVVTYTDGSQDKKPLSEFVTKAPTVELPYSNQEHKQIYVYTGENTDLTFKAADDTAVKDMYVRGPGGIGEDNTARYGFTTGKIENSAVTHGDGTVSGATATIKMTGVTTLKAPNRWTSFVVANDNDNAPSNTDFNALDKNPNATQTPGYVQFIVKSQTDKYDIATPAPADKVEVADPTNVTNDDLDKIKEKLQLEYNKKNDDANISKDSPVDKNGKIQSVTKDDQGNLVVTYTDGSKDTKPLTEFVTKKPTTPDTEAPAKPVVNTDLTGKAGTKTPVEVSAEPGSKVELFDKDGNKIGEGTADKNGKATVTPTVNIPEGNVTAKATDPSGNVSVPSDPAKATTPSTPDTEAPAKPVVDTDLTGKAGTKTPVVVSAEPGSKVELFDKDGNKIGEGTADKNGKATVTPTVNIPEGNVTAKATDPSGNVSVPSDPAKATTPSTPDTEAPAKPVVDTDLTGKAGTKTPVVVSAEPGSKVELFDKDGNKIGEGTADKNGKATITPTVNIPEGNVTAKATDPSGNVSVPSEPAKATTGADTEAPAKPVVNTDLTGKAGTKTPVEVSAEPGSKVELFDKDGNKIGEGTADKNGKATITPTVNIPEGNVTAKATDPSGNVSVPSDPAKATTPSTPDTEAPAKPVVDTDLTGKAGTKTPVVVSAEPGSKVELFDKDGNKIGEGTADKNGKATITPTVNIPEGNVTAKATDPSGNVSVPSDPAKATTPSTPDTEAPAKPVVDTDLTGKAGTKTPVVVSAEPGSKVELFDKDGNKIGEGTADNNGKATVTPTVNIPEGNVTAKATDPSGNVSVPSEPAKATTPSTPDTEAPAKPEVKTDLTGKAGTKTPVEVNAEPGSKVELFDKDGNKIGEATAGTDGKATITPTVAIPEGNVTAKATDPSGNVSEPSEPAKATTPSTPDTEAPAKPEVKTDLTGKAGTKTPVEVNAEPGSKVELFDKDGNKIGEATAGTDGKATITPTVAIPEGNVTAKATDAAGNTSDASEPAKATTAKEVKTPAVTPVANSSALTDAEKAKVADEVKKANPTVTDVKVGEDGTATVTFPDGSTANLTPAQTVKEADSNGVKTPAVTPVANPSALTDAEKAKVADEVKKANPTVTDVKVGEDGTATVTFPDGSKATLTPAQTVKEADSNGVKTPAVTPVANPSSLTDAEKAKVADEVKKSNPTATDVKVGEDGTTTVTFPDGSKATLTPAQTVKEADSNGVKTPAVTPVANPSSLTDAEKAKVADEVKKSNPTATDVKVGEDGTTTVTFPDGSKATLTPAQTVKEADKELKDPAVTPVTDPSNLTDAEKAKVADEVKKSNPTVTDVKVGEDGTTTVTYPGGTTAVLPSNKTVKRSVDKELKDPAVTPVTNPSNLTDAEKAKVAEEVKKANPTVTDVKVGEDGTTTVTYSDGTTATLTPEKTVKEADSNGVNSPAVTPVVNPSALTDAEKAKVAEEVKKANPTVTDVKVGEDGTTTVTFPDGTTAVISPDKTVKKSADKVIKDPAVTPVVNPSALTDAEKAKVAEEVKKANPTVTDVKVGEDGTATVTYPDGTIAVIPSDKTVKKSDDKVIKIPAVTPVVNPSALTDAEKAKVADEVKKANPTASKVEVGNDGTATVTYPDGSTAILTPEKTVKEADSNGVKTPAVTPVVNPSALTDAEKAKVADEVKKANPTATDVKVGEDGTATVTFPDGSKATLTPAQTVKEADSNGVKTPAVTPVANPSALTDAEKAKVADEVKKANPTASKVEVGNDGTATVTYPDGSTAILTPEKTVKEADSNGVKTPAVTPVVNPSALTDAEKAKVADEVKKANPTATDVKVGEDGTATVTFPDGSKATLTPAQTVKEADSNGVKTPAVTPVANPSALTDAEKAKVAEEVKKANPTATDVKVGEDGTATVTFPDGTTAVIPADKTVKKSSDKAKESDGVKNPSVTPVTDPSNLTDAEKAKVAEEVKKANPTATDVKVGEDGTATVTFPDGSTASLTPAQTVKEADSNGVKTPAVTPVANPSALTDAEKAKVADEVKKANPTASKVEVGNDGTATVTFPDGSKATLTPAQTVKEADKELKDPAVTPVTDPSNLTDAEKAKVAEEVKKANPTVTDVKVGEDGTTTVTYPGGTTAVLPSNKTVKRSVDKELKDPAVTPVVNPSALTDSEKAKVVEEVKKANPTVTDVKVGEDGTTTVTYSDGTTATLTPEKTVKEADSNGVNSPAVTPVVNPSALTDAEKAKVANEVKKANPTVTDVKVGEDGTTTVTFPDGTTAVISPDKTVKKSADKVIKDPAVTPVVNPSALTDAEKAKVADEVKKANPTVTDVKVGEDGTATVTYPDGTTAVIPSDKTVKKSDDKVIKIPAVTPVVNPSALTDSEKAKVADEVKKANPTATDVKVGEDGTATVTFPDGSTANLTPAQTVKEADSNGVKTPAVTPVANPSALTDAEKAKVADEVKKANPTATDVKVGEDGTATVTFPDGSTASLTPAQTVKEADSNGVKTPAVTPVANPSALTDAEKAKVAEEVKKANPTATDVKVGEDGTATVTFPDGSTASLTPAQTVKEADSNGVKTPAVTPVANPSALTDAEKAKVAEEVKKANPTATDVKVGEDGTTTVTFPDGSTANLTPAQTVKEADSNGVKTPAVTPVANPSALTDAEKAKVAEEVKKANPTATDVKVGEDGTATVTFPDGTTAVIPADKTVKKSSDKAKESDGVKNPSVTPVTDPSNLTDAEKAKVAEEVKKANPTAKDIKVNNDGSVVVTFEDGSVAVIPAEKAVTAVNQDSPAQEPAKKAGAKELPNTGTKQSNASLGLALLAAVTGGLLIAKKREEEE